MALLRIELKNYNKGGTLPVGVHAQYLVGPSMREHVAHTRRERPAEAPRADLIARGHQHMPGWAQGQELMYWQAAQQYSRKNACLAKEVLISLPREFDHPQNLALIRQFLASLPPCPTTWAFHEPHTRNGAATQPHCHILVSPRHDLQHGQEPARYFKQPNHGGVPSRPLWTTRQEVVTLRTQWETLLRDTLRAQGLEHTLQRGHRDKELRLSWTEMKALERFVRNTAPKVWGHEYRLTGRTIQQWQTHGQITLRQATWLAQRSQRQLTWQITREQPRVWDATATLTQARPWQVLTKRRARTARNRSEAVIARLQRQRQQVGRVYLTWLSPRLRQQQERYRQAKQQERAQRQMRQRHAGGRPRTQGRQEHTQLPTLDRVLEQQQRQRQAHTWER
jgi:hypothetical protein